MPKTADRPAPPMVDAAMMAKVYRVLIRDRTPRPEYEETLLRVCGAIALGFDRCLEDLESGRRSPIDPAA